MDVKDEGSQRKKNACNWKKINEYGFLASSSSLLVVNQKFRHCLYFICTYFSYHALKSLFLQLYNKMNIHEKYEADDLSSLKSPLNDFWQFIL